MTSTLFHTRHHTFFTSLVLFTWACSVVVLGLMAYEVDTGTTQSRFRFLPSQTQTLRLTHALLPFCPSVGNVDGFFAFTLFNTAFSMLMLGGLCVDRPRLSLLSPRTGS